MLALDFGYLSQLGNERINGFVRKLDEELKNMGLENEREFSGLYDSDKYEMAQIALAGKGIDSLLNDSSQYSRQESKFIWIDIVPGDTTRVQSGAGKYAGEDYFNFSEAFLIRNPEQDKFKAFGPKGLMFTMHKGKSRSNYKYVFTKISDMEKKDFKKNLTFFNENYDLSDKTDDIIDLAEKKQKIIAKDGHSLAAVIITVNGKNKLFYKDYRKKVFDNWLGGDSGQVEEICSLCGNTKKLASGTNSLEVKFFTNDKGAENTHPTPSDPFKKTEDDLGLCGDCILKISAGISHIYHKQNIRCGPIYTMFICSEEYKVNESIANNLSRSRGYVTTEPPQLAQDSRELRRRNVEIYFYVINSAQITLYPVYYGQFKHLNRPLGTKWTNLADIGLKEERDSPVETWDILHWLLNTFSYHATSLHKDYVGSKLLPIRQHKLISAILNGVKNGRFSKIYWEFVYGLNTDVLKREEKKEKEEKSFTDWNSKWKGVMYANLLSQILTESEGTGMNEKIKTVREIIYNKKEHNPIAINFLDAAGNYTSDWSDLEVSVFGLGALCAYLKKYQDRQGLSSSWLDRLGSINTSAEIMHLYKDAASKAIFLLEKEYPINLPSGGEVVLNALITLASELNSENLNNMALYDAFRAATVGAGTYNLFARKESENQEEEDAQDE